MAVHDDTAFVVDTVQGQVQQLDPRTLVPVGETLRFPPGITGGVFDGKGRLWMLVPSEGTVVAVDRGRRRPSRPRQRAARAAAARRDPVKVKTVGSPTPATTWRCPPWTTAWPCSTGPPRTLTTLRGDAAKKVPLPLTGAGRDAGPRPTAATCR